MTAPTATHAAFSRDSDATPARGCSSRAILRDGLEVRPVSGRASRTFLRARQHLADSQTKLVNAAIKQVLNFLPRPKSQHSDTTSYATSDKMAVQFVH